MPSPETTPTTLLHAYRHLLRAALRAVQFSKPARYVVRDQIREGFEPPRTTTATPAAYDAERVRRTVWFLKAAAHEAGLESRILKSLVRVAWERKEGRGPRMTWKGTLAVAKGREGGKGKRLVFFSFWPFLGGGEGGCLLIDVGRVQTPSVVVKTAYSHYDLTVKMLNDTMGLCLR